MAKMRQKATRAKEAAPPALAEVPESALAEAEVIASPAALSLPPGTDHWRPAPNSPLLVRWTRHDGGYLVELSLAPTGPAPEPEKHARTSKLATLLVDSRTPEVAFAVRHRQSALPFLSGVLNFMKDRPDHELTIADLRFTGGNVALVRFPTPGNG